MTRWHVLVIAALLVSLVAWHPARVAAQALVLLPALFPSAPFDPLALLTSEPVREVHTASYAAGTVNLELFHPRAHGPHGAMILMLGAGELERRDLAVHFANALARLGIVTLLAEPSGMLAQRLTFDEVDAIRTSLNLLARQTDVDPTRVGLVGLSASGGLAIIAAAQPDLRERVRFVNSFGSYHDTTRLLVDVASKSMVVDGQVRPWQPDSRTVDVVANALREAGVQELDREELVRGTSREKATAILVRQPSVATERLDAVSPSAHLSAVRAHLYLMHDVDDVFIPFTESRHLTAQAPPGLVERYTEFSIFAHVIPDRPVPWQTFLPDLWRLFWHVHAVLLEVL